MPNLSALEQQVLKNLDGLQKQYEKSIQTSLAQALTSMRGEMTKIYEKYATNGKLTRAEMTKYNKYVTMEKQMLDLIDPAIKANIRDVKRLLPEMYNESYFQHAWAMDNGNGVRVSWGTINPDAITELFSITNPKNIEMMEALKNYGPTAKKYIRGALLKGLSMGKSLSSMVADLRNALNKTNAQILRIVRTEALRALNKGQNDLYLKAQEKGIEGVEVWDATLDGRTRPSHQKMDGVKKSKDGYFHGAIGKAQYPGDANLPPEESINCRCRIRFEVDGYGPLLRRSRDQGVIPYQTYEDWIKTYGPAFSKPREKKSALDIIIGGFNATDLNSEG